ncbi:MAG: hypothetical protein DI534_00575 [Leifsonia xyli]|nr:MAG: hypothetical protein DI534_00575 [Leifsonia xyli]
MRIVVSGSHCTGKSTLIAAFASRHPRFEVYGDPHELAGGGSGELIPDLVEDAAAAMESVDLLVLLPVSDADDIHVPADEDRELRAEMDAALLAFADDPELVPASIRTIELAGSPEHRLALLEDAI